MMTQEMNCMAFSRPMGRTPVFLANMRVYHFLAQGRAPAAFLCTLAAQWMFGSMLLTYIGTLFADTRAEPTHLLRP